ncbi:hypothetical protein CCMA1212_004144 [Trichoderma ghanense]|uniref:Uncharacterized protein n=1 Tax=Trichoderma ghanense TaxID=65468 RepID=A0ABY2H7Z3_9HYPO
MLSGAKLTRTDQYRTVLPDVAEVLEATYYTESPWAKAHRVRVRQTDGSEETYFMKVHELGNWRFERNKFTGRYFESYHSFIPKSEPIEDYDDRNALYSTELTLVSHEVQSARCGSAPGSRMVSPHRFVKDSCDRAIDEIRRLVEAYPEGYAASC